MSSGDNNKSKGQKSSKKMLVSYGRIGTLGWFEHQEALSYGRIGTLGWFEHQEAHISKLATHVVIKTKRGLELGKIVGTQNYRAGQFKCSRKQVEQYYCNRTKDYPLGDGGRFVRFATQQDLSEQRHLEKNAIGEAKTCQRITEELGLKMKIVEAEHLFGGERIIFYFTSENRVDFRELVRQLAKEYQTRIELRQIGSRDEARLISDYESCGQQCCCSRFLKILEPVNMRMAKIQKATLDPSKISGHCGRLKCCLRYEDENYLELKRKPLRVRAKWSTHRFSLNWLSFSPNQVSARHGLLMTFRFSNRARKLNRFRTRASERFRRPRLIENRTTR
ncbi:MAG: PSP1 domain-containing protein [Planctomycetota bacterium]|jgi:cell fate regulator YaaT (PSP1 superfamily)